MAYVPICNIIKGSFMKPVSIQDVRTRLIELRGALTLVSKESGVSYDTVLRIMHGEGDPGYSKVEMLHNYLFKKK